jgi:hypothetical protein
MLLASRPSLKTMAWLRYRRGSGFVLKHGIIENRSHQIIEGIFHGDLSATHALSLAERYG